jgi:hypothetical protein
MTEGNLAGQPIRVVLTQRTAGAIQGTVVIPGAAGEPAKVHHYEIEDSEK